MSDWRAKAACVAEVAKAETPQKAGRIADMWYPETLDKDVAGRQRARDKAIAICRRCPVSSECEADRGHILVTKYGHVDEMKTKADRDGIRAGVDPNKNLRANRVAQCGTPGGYYRHRRTLKEDPCDACKAAHTADQREREQRRKAAA